MAIRDKHRARDGAPPRRVIAVSILLRALIAAAIGGALVLGITGWEWIHTRGHPTEHTVVISVSVADGQAHCGKFSTRDNRSVTRRSADPPNGLPAVFSHVEACDVPRDGDRQTVIRVPRGDQDPKVYVEPLHSFAVVAGVSSLAVGLVFLMGLILFSVKELWRSAWRRFDARGRAN